LSVQTGGLYPGNAPWFPHAAGRERPSGGSQSSLCLKLKHKHTHTHMHAYMQVQAYSRRERRLCMYICYRKPDTYTHTHSRSKCYVLFPSGFYSLDVFISQPGISQTRVIHILAWLLSVHLPCT